MTKDKFFDMIEIDSPADLEYFEQMAELLENEADIPFDLFYIALSEISADTASELLGNYFKELEDSVPEGADDLESLIDTLQQQILSYADGIDDTDTRRDLAQELYKFRQWYHDPEGALIDGEPCSVMDALYEHRAEGFAGGSHDYEFPGALTYELGELTVKLGSFEKIDVVEPDEGLYGAEGTEEDDGI